MSRRIDRVNVVLQQAISSVLAEDLRDPRLGEMVSVVRVDASPDLGSARVYVSVLGDEDAKVGSMRALKSAAGFVHRRLRGRVTLRSVPAVEFRLDESIETGSDVLSLISRVRPADGPGKES